MTPEWFDFVLHDWLALPMGSGRFRHLDRTSIRQSLDLALHVGRQYLAPHARTLDANPPQLVDGKVQTPEALKQALAATRDAGFFSACVDLNQGGAQMPLTVGFSLAAIFCRFDATVQGYLALTQGVANLLRNFGTPAQKARHLSRLDQGLDFGTMCLSEPHAGSSVGDVRTKATLQADGNYHLRGSKMWVSGAEHELSDNIVHMVLARIDGAPAGTKGLSLFVVPRYRFEAGQRVDNGVRLIGLNHKMGYRGTVNGLLALGEDQACVAELLGAAQGGMACMFQMMNEARIAVGVSAAAIGWRGFEIAQIYAKERVQGRALVNNDPTSAAIPIAQHPDVKRMLLKAKAQSEAALLMCLYTAKVAESADPNADKLASLLTPMAKSWPAKYALEANDLAIQILGGAGYTHDWIVEKLYRDNRLNAIHEGTHGIQGLDLMGRKVFADQGAGLVLLLQRIADTAQRAVRSPRLADIAPSALEAGSALAQAVLPLASRLPDGQADMAFANASLLLDALGTVVACWLTLDIALCAQEKADPQAGAWIAQARYLHLYELPQTQYVASLLKHADRTVLDAPL